MEELKALEENGTFVFHGTSERDLKMLIPQEESSLGQLELKPYVAAYTHSAVAAFIAVFRSKGAGSWTGQIQDQVAQFQFSVPEAKLQQAKKEQWSGHVYVAGRINFQQNGPWEWRSYSPVEPFRSVWINVNDVAELLNTPA